MSIFASWGRKAAEGALRKAIPGMVKEVFEKELDRRLPGIIEEILADRFKNRPDDPLSEVGFNWALALALREKWPAVPKQEAVRWLREYIEVPYGHKDYDWTPSAAKLIANEYVNEFGE